MVCNLHRLKFSATVKLSAHFCAPANRRTAMHVQALSLDDFNAIIRATAPETADEANNAAIVALSDPRSTPLARALAKHLLALVAGITPGDGLDVLELDCTALTAREADLLDQVVDWIEGGAQWAALMEDREAIATA